MCTTPGLASSGRTATPGAPSERATPATVRRCSEALKTSTAAAMRCSSPVGMACTWRGSRAGSDRAREDSLPARRRGRSVRAGGGGSALALASTSAASPFGAGFGRPRERSLRSSEPRLSELPSRGSNVGVEPSRTQPSFTARDVHSSHTDRRSAPSRYTWARSPRSSVRPHTSQLACVSVGLMSLVLKAIEGTEAAGRPSWS